MSGRCEVCLAVLREPGLGNGMLDDCSLGLCCALVFALIMEKKYGEERIICIKNKMIMDKIK